MRSFNVMGIPPRTRHGLWGIHCKNMFNANITVGVSSSTVPYDGATNVVNVKPKEKQCMPAMSTRAARSHLTICIYASVSVLHVRRVWAERLPSR